MGGFCSGVEDPGLSSGGAGGFCLAFRELAWFLRFRIVVWPLQFRMLAWPLLG